METKACAECKNDKPLDEFYFKNKSKGYRDSKCKKCRYQIMKKVEHPIQTDGNRCCRICQQWKPLTDFASARRNRQGREYQCMKCRQDNRPEEYKKRKLEYNTNYQIYKNYGISREEYDSLINSINCCPICLKSSEEVKIVLDHCHETNRIRGPLCRGCNSALGHLGDTEEALLRALAHVKFNQ